MVAWLGHWVELLVAARPERPSRVLSLQAAGCGWHYSEAVQCLGHCCVLSATAIAALRNGTPLANDDIACQGLELDLNIG